MNKFKNIFVLILALLLLSSPAKPQFIPPINIISNSGGGGFGNIYNISLTGTDTLSLGSTLGSYINNSLLTAPSGTPTQIIVTLKAGSSNFTTTALTICNQSTSNQSDCVSTPTPLLFSGSQTISIPAGTAVDSDTITFSWDKTKGIVVKAYNGGTLSFAVLTGCSSSCGDRYDISTNTTTSTSTGVTLDNGNRAALIQKIQTNGF